jgi:hypothetical protein
MADSIQLPNSASKDLSTTKITPTARQKFEKRQPRRHDMGHPSNKEQTGASIKRDDPDLFGRNPQDNKVVKRAIQNRSGNSSDGGQGNIIDICI